MLCLTAAACGDDSNTTAPTADMGADTSADTDTDADTVPPTVSISSGLRSNAAGNYRLEGIAFDNRGLATLTYAIDDAPEVPITPAASPFTVDLSLDTVATITVTATDAAGNQGTASITVTRASVEGLTADFTVSAETSTFSPVLFDAVSSVDPQGRPLDYDWDFGDSTIGFGVTTAHLYPSAGTYTVKLVVSTADGDSDEVTRDIVIADPTPASFATLQGVVVDTKGAPVQEVSVVNRAGTLLTTTDSLGQFSLMAGTDVPLIYVFKRGDYTTQVLRTQIQGGNATAKATVRMMPRGRPVFLMDAAAGGTVEGDNGARIEFPANALVDDETGAAVTGPVAVTLTPVDHQTNETLAFPGLFEGVHPDGTAGPLTSFGLMEVTLSQDGRKVQLAPGKPAIIELPYTAPDGQVGTTIAVWSLDEKTGLWFFENDSPIQAATTGGGLVQRAEISHFSWINCDRLTPNPAIRVPFEFTSDGTTITEEFEVDVDYECQRPGRSASRIPDAKSGEESLLFYSNCDATMQARSVTGRYFGTASLNTGDSTTPIVIEVLDTTKFTLLTPSMSTQATLAADGRKYYVFDALALNSFSVRVSSLSAGFSGAMTLIPPTRIGRPTQAFAAQGVTTAHATGTGAWVVSVDAIMGSGDFEIELAPDPGAVLQNHVSQTAFLQAGASRDFVVNASANDFARILFTGGQSIGLNVLDTSGNPMLTALSSGSDTGIFEFKEGGTFIVRLQNFGADANLTLTYAVSAPAVAVTSNHLTSAGALKAGQVAVFVLPHVGDSGVVASVRNSNATNAAPQVSMLTGIGANLPSPSLTAAELRNPEETEAFAALRVPVVANESPYGTFVYVSMPTHGAENFDLELDRMSKAGAITVGTCQGADTTSATAAAIALEDNGVLTFCSEDHKTFDGLRMAQPHFTLKGMDRSLSRLVSWSDAYYGVTTGTYGANPILATMDARFEDLTIVNRNHGVSISWTDTLQFERVNIDADTPLNLFNASRCVLSDGGFSSRGIVSFVDSRCVNAQEGLNLTNIDDISLSGSMIDTTEIGILSTGSNVVAVQDNVFTGSRRAISIQQNKDLATITGNDLTQANAASGYDSVFLTLRNQTIALPSTQSVIQANIIRLSGLNSNGIAFGYNANNGDLLIDGNNIIGNASGQIGIRALGSFTNVYGGVVNIQNNVLRDMGRHAVHILQTDTYTALGLFNNSVRVPITGVNSSIFNIETKNTGGTGILDFYNNIVMGGGTAKGLAYTATLSTFYGNNLFYQVGTPYRPSGNGPAGTLGAGDLETDPMFVNDDLMVNPNSPAVDGGTGAGLVPFTAYGGGARPVGVQHDIGAHEQ